MKLCFFGSEPEHKRIMDLLKTIPKYSDYVPVRRFPGL